MIKWFILTLTGSFIWGLLAVNFFYTNPAPILEMEAELFSFDSVAALLESSLIGTVCFAVAVLAPTLWLSVYLVRWPIMKLIEKEATK